FVYSRYSKYFIFRLLLFQTVRYLFSHRHLDSAKVHVAFTKFLTLYFRNIVRTFWAFSSGWYILFISQMFRQDHSFCLYISITSKKHDKDSPYIALTVSHSTDQQGSPRWIQSRHLGVQSQADRSLQ